MNKDDFIKEAISIVRLYGSTGEYEIREVTTDDQTVMMVFIRNPGWSSFRVTKIQGLLKEHMVEYCSDNDCMELLETVKLIIR